MKPSMEQYERIYQAWQQCLPPLYVARQLRLVPLTVISEYVRLDELTNAFYEPFLGSYEDRRSNDHQELHV